MGNDMNLANGTVVSARLEPGKVLGQVVCLIIIYGALALFVFLSLSSQISIWGIPPPHTMPNSSERKASISDRPS
jgi:hypothetical protein